jgi:hypothetical protein
MKDINGLQERLVLSNVYARCPLFVMVIVGESRVLANENQAEGHSRKRHSGEFTKKNDKELAGCRQFFEREL